MKNNIHASTNKADFEWASISQNVIWKAVMQRIDKETLN